MGLQPNHYAPMTHHPGFPKPGTLDKPPRGSLEDLADHLQDIIKQRIEVMTGFGNPKRLRDTARTTFERFDKNKSGALSYAEFDLALNSIRCGEGPIAPKRALFDRYDTNLDGHLSVDELVDGVYDLKPHPLAHKEFRRMLDRVRTEIVEKGGIHGVHTLRRIFRIMDDGGNNRIEPAEFKFALKDMGISITKDELEKAMTLFDKNKDGGLDVNEFTNAIRGKMNPRRIDLVRAAFQVLDREGRGVVTMDDLMQIFDPSLHPDVKEGKITPEQCVRDFGKQWDTLERDGVITFDEFLEYYRDISAAIPMDDYFELMICNAWRMAPPGADSSAHATRVLVTFENGRSEMVEIEDDAGLDVHNVAAVRKRLYMQGVKNVASIQTN